ncbi:MAG: hypothetical protein WBG36_12855 [Ornithinimicrobium sp.]
MHHLAKRLNVDTQPRASTAQQLRCDVVFAAVESIHGTVLNTPRAEELGEVAASLRGWQYDDGPLHLAPGDLGWYSSRGAAATAAAIRTWSRGQKIFAVGLLDGPQLLRMAVDPESRDDEELARQIVADVNDPCEEYSMLGWRMLKLGAPRSWRGCCC